MVFWLLLGVISVVTAEVSVASAPLAFVNPIEAVFLVVFYGSHLLVFAWLAFRRGWPALPTLWFAGVLFGLYEFYITKVLWVPPWGDVITIGYIDIVSLIVLAFFWHPFMAFILPLAAAERLGTGRNGVWSQLPKWLTAPSRRRAVLGLGAAALVHGTLTGSTAIAVLSTASGLGAVATAAWWWRRRGRAQTWNLAQLLPSDRQARVLTGILALQYVVFIPLWSPEKMPPLIGHVVVWLLYAGFALLLTSTRSRSTPTLPPAAVPLTQPRARHLAAWAGSLILIAAIGSAVPAELGFIPVWGIATVIGLRMLARSIRWAVTPQRLERLNQ